MTLPITADCFNSLDIPCWGRYSSQYLDPTDCPIARACKAVGGDFRIGPFSAITNGGFYECVLRLKGDIPDVERCREELLAGADVAYITITEILRRDLCPESFLNAIVYE